jgi:hypothetical protein
MYTATIHQRTRYCNKDITQYTPGCIYFMALSAGQLKCGICAASDINSLIFYKPPAGPAAHLFTSSSSMCLLEMGFLL